jgi:hypothetical protein
MGVQCSLNRGKGEARGSLLRHAAKSWHLLGCRQRRPMLRASDGDESLGAAAALPVKHTLSEERLWTGGGQ